MAEVDRSEVVVDTDVLSFVFNRDRLRGFCCEQLLEDRQVIVPFVLVGEMRFGAAVGGWGAARRARLEKFLADYRHAYADNHICTLWASLRAGLSKRGRTIERQDAWIAAIALSYRLPLLTHNVNHFRHVPRLEIVTA